MSDLTLPYDKSGPSSELTGNNGNAFSITLTDGGGAAIGVESFGTDAYGDVANGIYAESDGVAVFGVGIGGGVGVYGSEGNAFAAVPNDRPAGVAGFSGDNYGLFGSSAGYDGVKGVSASQRQAGVAAINTSDATGQVPSGYAVWASSTNTGVYAQGTPAGYFQGDVLVTGDLVLVNQGGDLAEDFDVETEPHSVEAGTVLVIGGNGSLCASSAPYDTRVAGVVAGAGTLKPAIVLQRIPSLKHRSPVALVGKVFCKVDATFAEIIAGDLLTTSPTPGHAMKAAERSRALGAIIGKALAGLDTGRGLIPILVSPR